MLTTYLFYLFAASLLACAYGVITSKNAVKSVLFLISCFLFAAALWVLLEAEFLAFALVVVYVGAVMVLFLFVIMMLNLDRVHQRVGFVRYWPVAALVGALLAGLLILVLGPQQFGLSRFPAPAPMPASYSSIKTLGLTLFTQYVYPFELAGLILLVAMIAAITLTFRGQKKGGKRQIIAQQLTVNPNERVHLVDLGTTKKASKQQAKKATSSKRNVSSKSPRRKT